MLCPHVVTTRGRGQDGQRSWLRAISRWRCCKRPCMIHVDTAAPGCKAELIRYAGMQARVQGRGGGGGCSSAHRPAKPGENCSLYFLYYMIAVSEVHPASSSAPEVRVRHRVALELHDAHRTTCSMIVSLTSEYTATNLRLVANATILVEERRPLLRRKRCLSGR